MSRFATWGVGDWVVFGISVFVVLAGLYSIVFARRLEAQQEEKLREQGDYDGGGYRPRLMQTDQRTVGMVLVGIGAFGILQNLVLR